MVKCIEKDSKSIKTQKSKKTAKVNKQVDKDKQWDVLTKSLEKFSDDFMNIREQPELQKRYGTKSDALVKSRHSRLSGIVLPHKILKKKDSGQAGMTLKGDISTFYESVKSAKGKSS